MKIPALILGLVFLANAAVASGGSVSDEARIRDALNRWRIAFEHQDVDTLMRMYPPDETLVAYDMSPPLSYRGAKAYRKDYQDFFEGFTGPLSVEERDVHVFADGRIGYAFGLERIAGTLKTGERSEVWTRFTDVFRKIGGRWYAVHEHVSVPVDVATGKASLDLKP